jgi:hypothetical protein
MKITIQTISLLILFQVFLVSCSSSDDNPPLSFENKYINQQILLRAPDYSNTFSITDPISLELKYNSTNEIVFPNNYNLKIFEKTADGWVEVKEKPTERYPPDDIVLSPTKYMPAVQVVPLFPDLLNPFVKHELRIYVIGNMKTGDGIKEVAAYTDVILHP